MSEFLQNFTGEVFVLNPSTFRPERMIEGYESLIWTDRYAEFGEFRIVGANVSYLGNLLPQGTLIGQANQGPIGSPVSDQIMVVETVLVETDADDKVKITISGRSFDKVMADAGFLYFGAVTAGTRKWALEGTGGFIAFKIVKNMLVDGQGLPQDVIPKLRVIDESTTNQQLDLQLEIGSLFDRVKEVIDPKNIGFRVTRDLSVDAGLVLRFYNGVNRAMDQSVRRQVIFSPELENMAVYGNLQSTEGYKNIAYVYSPAGFEIVGFPAGSENLQGLDRRVLMVSASDISAGTANAAAKLRAKGRAELAKARRTSSVDGEVITSPELTYRTHYNLGDFVGFQVGNTYSTGSDIDKKQISEYTWIADEEGVRSYPGFKDAEFVWE